MSLLRTKIPPLVTGDYELRACFRLGSTVTFTTVEPSWAGLPPTFNVDFDLLKRGGTKLRLMFVACLVNNTTGVISRVRLMDYTVIGSPVPIEESTVWMSGTTTKWLESAIVDIDDWVGVRRIAVQGQVSATSTGTLYASSEILVLAEVGT